MNIIYFLLYILLLVFIFWLWKKEPLPNFTELSPRRRILLPLSVFLIVSLFFSPYFLGLTNGKHTIPAVLFSLPFFLLSVFGMGVQIFYPQKVQAWGSYYLIAIGSVIVFLALTPLCISLVSR